MSRLLLPLLCLLGLLTAGHAGPPPARPNVLFLITDDQRWDALGVVQQEQGERGRFPWFRTPNLDRLSREGVRFRNAFVVSSLCSPSRAAFLTGRYNHENGVVNNHTPFPATETTWGALLGQAGYRTGYVGKFHHGQQRGKRPGFDYSASYVGQGRFHDCPFQVDGVMTPTTGWVDDVATDFALRFLAEKSDRPFALVLGFKSSHGPWTPPERLKDAYATDTARPVPNLTHRAVYRQPPAAAGGGANPPDRSPMIRNYFRTLAGVDENVGRVLKALDDQGLARNTIVVFASDNGYYLGEHGLGDKRSCYEESIRIPLLVRYPAGFSGGRTVDRMALNIDLAPTLLDYAGLPVPANVQGRSWRPLLEGRQAPWRTAWFYEYFLERGLGPQSMQAVRTETAKLVRYPNRPEWTELFDLAADPYEIRNLWDEPAAAELRARLEREFEEQARAVGFRVPPNADELNPNR